MKNGGYLFPAILLVALPFFAIRVSHAQSDPLAPTEGVKSAEQIDREWQQSVSKYDAERNRLLAEADRQAHDGPYRPDWATLNKYEQPQWYKDAKFGIFIHWGVYSVPAAENEWYPRKMYNPKDGAHKNFEEHFEHGDPSKGYKDLIPLFRAEHFNAADWAKLFKEAGARYVVPVAEHRKASIHALGTAHEGASMPVGNVELLGSPEKLSFTQAADALDVTLPAGANCKYAYALKVTAK